MTGRQIAIFLLSLALCQCSFAKEHVPVLIWNINQAQGGVPAVSALQYISYDNFQANYLNSFKPNNILLFLQDSLSVEDLTSHTTELQHIKHWKENGHSLFLPNVEDAAHLVHDLPAHGYNVVKLDHDAGLNLKQDDKNLVVVDLPSTLTNPSRRRAMQKADEVMENVISKIGDQRDFTIIFTGMKPSVDEHSDQYEQHIRVGARSLKAINDNGYHSHNCSMMYLKRNMILRLYSKDGTFTDVEIPEKNNTDASGDCGNPARLMVNYRDIVIDDTTYSKLKVTFYFPKNRGSWELSSANLTLQNGTLMSVNKRGFLLRNKMDKVPIGMSFACTEKYYLSSKDEFLNYDHADLVLEHFQLQAYTTKTKFDSAWDCVGFFTVPIWCGLLMTILLVIILSIGMFMLSDIKTMDRFDDPKGQPIMVATAEG